MKNSSFFAEMNVEETVTNGTYKYLLVVGNDKKEADKIVHDNLLSEVMSNFDSNYEKSIDWIRNINWIIIRTYRPIRNSIFFCSNFINKIICYLIF